MSLSDPQELKRRNRELAILNAITQGLNREVDLKRALQTTLGKVAEIFDLETGWIWLMNPENGEPYLAAAQNLPPGLANYPRRMEGWCYCLETYQAGDLDGAANVNVVTCSRLKNLIDGTDGLRHHASIPLYAQENKLGVLNVASSDWRQLSAGDLRLLHTIGDLLSIAIERAYLFAQRHELGAVEERNRLAREIHDTLAQSLTGIALKLETADALLANDAAVEYVRRMIEEALALTQASLEEVRRSVLDLRAAPLENQGLLKALQTLIKDHQAAGLALREDFPESLPLLPVRVEVGLYRIAQEALNNIQQHAQADEAHISLLAHPENINLVIKDNGIGFDPQNVPSGRYGLMGLRERTHLLGGSLTLETSQGQGTRLQVSLPI